MWMHALSIVNWKKNEQTKTQLIWDRIEETKNILSIWTHALVHYMYECNQCIHVFMKYTSKCLLQKQLINNEQIISEDWVRYM